MMAVVGRRLMDLRRPRVALGATLAVGAVAIAIDLAITGGTHAYYRPPLYVAIETTAALAGIVAAYLLFFRFRRSGRVDDLLLAIGLGIISASNLVYGAGPSAIEHTANRFDTWGLTAGHLLGTLVLAFAAFAPSRKLERPKRAAWLVIGYSVVALMMLAEALIALASGLSLGAGSAGGHDAALTVQLVQLTLFAAAPLAFLRRAERDGADFMPWLAVASGIRVFAGIDYAFRPSLQTGWVYTGDIFRMLFYFALLAAAASEVTRYWQDSRETAVLDERRRIARDLHDGLAQELAFIVRHAKRTLEQEPRSKNASQIANAVERALDESRRVIAALPRPLDEPLDVVLSEAAKGVAGGGGPGARAGGGPEGAPPPGRPLGAGKGGPGSRRPPGRPGPPPRPPGEG